MNRALGISVHTGWGACVVVAGSKARPQIVANEVIEILGDAERFCFHMAADMPRGDVEQWLDRLREKAIANARTALAALVAHGVSRCAIISKPGDAGDLDKILASHPRLHMAEGHFYRDVLRAACEIPVVIVPPSSLDVASIGKLAPPPWGRDQKLAALAAWKALENPAGA
jgi:hypothetical protein